MSRTLVLAIALGTAVFGAACGRITREVRLTSDPKATVDELWQEPSDLERRNLFYGAGGERLFPGSTTFIFVARDTSGWSPGFDVRGQDGAEWSVKLGPEAQAEVVASRILWAIGFHQPPTYYRGLDPDGCRERCTGAGAIPAIASRHGGRRLVLV
jgi:hypothetical protein